MRGGRSSRVKQKLQTRCCVRLQLQQKQNTVQVMYSPREVPPSRFAPCRFAFGTASVDVVEVKLLGYGADAGGMPPHASGLARMHCLCRRAASTAVEQVLAFRQCASRDLYIDFSSCQSALQQEAKARCNPHQGHKCCLKAGSVWWVAGCCCWERGGSDYGMKLPRKSSERTPTPTRT